MNGKRELRAHLATVTGARTMAYSRFGYGESDAPPGTYGALDMHEREALEVLPEVLRQLEIEHPLLFGHRIGPAKPISAYQAVDRADG